MKNQFSKWLSVLAIASFVASIFVAPALGARQRKTSRDERALLTYGLIRRVQREADVFEKVLKPTLKTSVFSKTSRTDLVDRADNIGFGADQIRRKFKEGGSNEVLRPEVSDLFVAADRINIVIQNVDIGQPAIEQWSRLRDALNNLGALYGIRPLTDVSYLSKAAD